MKVLPIISLFNFLCLAIFAQNPIDLNQHNENSYIGKHISYFEDKTGTSSIESISSLPAERFISSKTDIINFGFSRSVFWLKFIIKSKDSLNKWIVEIRSPEIDSVSFYYKNENGIWKEKNDGDNWNYFNRDINSRNIAFKLPLLIEDHHIYFIKLKSISPITIPVKIETYDYFVNDSLRSELLFGICYGVLLIMLFYNFFIYFSIREISYLYYVLSVLGAILFYGSFYGHISQYITHFKSPLLNNFIALISILWSIAILQFVKSFLNLSKISKLYNRLVNIMLLLFSINLLLWLFLGPEISLLVVFPLVLLSSVIVLIASFVSFKKGSREARFFILGWGFYLCSIIIFVIKSLSLIPDHEYIIHILLLGSIVEVSLQSFALADKINIYRNQKEQAQNQIILLREVDAAKLELKVKERTLQLEQAKEEINTINKDLESFTYSASHDLRAPLRSILGFASFIEKKSATVLTEDSKLYLNNIQTSAKNMDQLIADLLAFSRLGKTELVKKEINMKDLVETVITELKSSQKPEHIIDIKIGVIENCIGDQILLKQVWVNLISNAIKYSMKKSKTAIEIASKTSDKEITYWVKDNGAGFNMKYSDKLFSAFQRLHSQIEFEGTGLGLSIVKKIIKGHDGKVWAESTEGEGATFYFSLPK